MGLLEKIRAAGGRIVADVGAADGPHIYLRERGYPGHDLEDQCVAGKILVFPVGRGPARRRGL